MLKGGIIDYMESLNNKVYVELNSVIELMQKYIREDVERLKTFLSSDCIDYSKDKQKIFTKHDIDNTSRFNFFESISDKWYRENFHSDVLYTILNPDTKEIGEFSRKYFMPEFVKFLGIEDRFNCNSDYEVIKEQPTGYISWKDNNENETGQKGFIDLLIKNETQAIIIENKINYAPDMDNQLVRYMKYVEEKLCIKEYSVVYLTLIDDKRPPLESYDSDFYSYTKKLKDKRSGILREIYAVNEEKSLAKNFFPDCIKRLQEALNKNTKVVNSCVIAEIYIDQYRILLEHLGGRAYMKTTDKKLIEEIYSNEEENKGKFEAARDFAEIWSRKDSILEEILNDKFLERFSSKGLPQKKSVNGCGCDYLWENKENGCYVFWSGNYWLGFTAFDDKKFSEQCQKDLFEKIHNITNSEDEYKDEVQVGCKIKDSSTLIDDVMNALKFLFNS